MFHIPVAIITFAHDIAHSVGPRSDGGRKVTLAELKQLAEDARKLAEAAAELLKFVQAHQ